MNSNKAVKAFAEKHRLDAHDLESLHRALSARSDGADLLAAMDTNPTRKKPQRKVHDKPPAKKFQVSGRNYFAARSDAAKVLGMVPISKADMISRLEAAGYEIV